MSFEEGLYSRLSGDATLAGLVSDRIYPVAVPQGVSYPHVVFRKRSGPSDYGLWEAPVMQLPIMEFDCFGASYESARGVANRVKALLDRFTGELGDAQVASSIKLNETEDPIDLENTKVIRIQMWFEMAYQE
jgi:hypothetical protein